MITWYRTHRLETMLFAIMVMAGVGLGRFWSRLDPLSLTVLVGGALGLFTNGWRALRSEQPEAVRQAQMACALYCIMAFALVRAAIR